MNDYQQEARIFLRSCAATMEFEYVGLEKPRWSSHKHCAYDCIIKTPRSEMKVRFYTSLVNTKITTMTLSQYIEETYRYRASDAPYTVKLRAQKELKRKQAEAVPTEYDVLACLTKYDVGSMDDFMRDFGYEIHCVEDMTDFINTYNAVVKEYNDVRRCFTDEQIEALAEIN